MNKQINLTWEQFQKQFRPQVNHFGSDPSNYNYETYGEELEYVRTKTNNHIWTYTDIELGSAIYNGYHWVNRISYIITEVPWEDGVDYEVDLVVDVECECYNEDEDVMETRNGEYGDPECKICEGYGYRRESAS